MTGPTQPGTSGPRKFIHCTACEFEGRVPADHVHECPKEQTMSDETVASLCDCCAEKPGTRVTSDGVDLCDTCWTVLKTPVVFGLRAQGHIPTIERMLAEGASWPEIGDAIGWCPDTAREWYERDQEVNS